MRHFSALNKRSVLVITLMAGLTGYSSNAIAGNRIKVLIEEEDYPINPGVNNMEVDTATGLMPSKDT